jgi:hypothetical protein
MQINLWKKGFVCGIIVLFLGTSVVSSIVQSDNEIVLIKKIQPIEISEYGAQSPNKIGSLIVGSWWNINWMYRKQITINYTQVAGNLVNFPVLVITTMDASKIQNDGDDIVFTDNDGIKLNHEIELYDSSTGKLIAWVNITRLSSTTDRKSVV